MAAAQSPDRVSLEEVLSRFKLAAYDHTNVDAVVIFRPDYRREELDRYARELLVKPADPESENYPAERTKETRDTYTALKYAADLETWIPPENGSIEKVGGQQYWSRVLEAPEYPELTGFKFSDQIWQCTLFGTKAREIENTALRLFNVLGEDAARLILPRSDAVGKALLSRWLIHLADRCEPLVPGSRRQYLAWPTVGGQRLSPSWYPVTPQNPPTRWWAVRLHNVFYHSRLAIEQAAGVFTNASVAHQNETVNNLSPARAEQSVGSQTLTTGSIHMSGASWEVSFEAERGVFPSSDYTALAVVSRLLSRPHHPFKMFDLMSADERAKIEQGESLDNVLDETAITDLQRRYEELQRDKSEQEDPLVRRENEDEEAKIVAELKKAIGPSGRKRNLGTTQTDKAWNALTKSLHRLWPRLRKEEMPKLAAHLNGAIRIDRPTITYHPPVNTPPWDIEV